MVAENCIAVGKQKQSWKKALREVSVYTHALSKKGAQSVKRGQPIDCYTFQERDTVCTLMNTRDELPALGAANLKQLEKTQECQSLPPANTGSIRKIVWRTAWNKRVSYEVPPQLLQRVFLNNSFGLVGWVCHCQSIFLLQKSARQSAARFLLVFPDKQLF